MEGERGDGAGKAGWGGVMVGVQPGGLRWEAGDGSGLEGGSLPPEPCPPASRAVRGCPPARSSSASPAPRLLSPEPCPPAPEVTLPPSPAAELGGETP